MTKYIIDKKIMGRLSLVIWSTGLVFFILLSFQYLRGMFEFIFSYLSASELPTEAVENAKLAFTILFRMGVTCLVLQLIVLASPRFWTGAAKVIASYHEHEEKYIEVISGRIDMAQRITKSHDSFDVYDRKIIKAHKRLDELYRDIEVLAEIIDNTRESLPIAYRKDPKLRGKGDF